MDPRSSAQDVHRCDLCETAIVHSYCDVCHVELCKPCIGEHISDEYDKHKIVSFKNRRSTLIYPKCEMHSQKSCKFQCEDCNSIFVCSSCTASKQHKGHTFLEVIEVYKTQKEVIENDTKELENQIFPNFEELTLDLENQLAILDGGYEKLTTIMSKQGEQWHREIDIVINKMKTEINEIKVKHKEILQKHLDDIKKILSLMKQSLLALKKIEKSNEVYHAIKYSSKIKKFRKLQPKIMLTLPTFISKPIDREKLYSLFGRITPLSTGTDENVFSQKKPSTSVRELLDKPELVVTIHIGYDKLKSVTCLNEEGIWTSATSTNDIIKCFNIEGLLLQTIQTETGEWPNDIALDSDGDILYIDRRTRTVNELKNGQTNELIRLQEWSPINLCVTSTGDLLVSMYNDDCTQSKVVRQSRYIQKQSIQFDTEGKPLYSGNSQMKYITENRNHDICVADYNAGAVVVVNKEGKLRWRYSGHPSGSWRILFKPYGVTTDSQCRILTAHRDSNCIHILDQNGQFLTYINTCNLDRPWGVCVDNNDNLFVVECCKGNVKKIKYLK